MGKMDSARRIDVTLTPQQTKMLNTYLFKLHKKLGRLPQRIKPKLYRLALEEWLKNHEHDFDIDWDTRK